MPTSALSVENFYESTLSSSITASDTTIPINTPPTTTEGYLIIEPDNASAREIIYFTGRSASNVTLPSAGAGRGQDGTSAVSHASGATVRMVINAQYWKDLKGLFTTTPNSWTSTGYAPDTVTALGNRSYTAVFNGVDLTGVTSVGQRLKLPRTVTAPTQCTSLNGTTQYFSKTSPSGLTFTTTFTCSAWVKLSSYSGAAAGIIARRNADIEGWSLDIQAGGTVRLSALRIASNFKNITSYQSIPLNKWVHVAATMDVAAGDTTAQKIWIDGVEVPRAYSLTGTATALVQGTTALVVGARQSAGADPFPGKIAQAAVFSAQLADATIKAMANQTMTGSETNLVSAYTFNNSINDLSANANNLTAQGSAVATNADTPFTNPVTGTSITAGTTNYGIITKQEFSTNTTYTIQIPEGETLPTTGGIGTVSYSTQKIPYGFPGDRGKWRVNCLLRTSSATTSNTNWGSFISDGWALKVPIGQFLVGWQAGNAYNSTTTSVQYNVSPVSLVGETTSSAALAKNPLQAVVQSSAAANMSVSIHINSFYSLDTQTTFVMYSRGATTNAGIDGASAYAEIYADNAYA